MIDKIIIIIITIVIIIIAAIRIFFRVFEFINFSNLYLWILFDNNTRILIIEIIIIHLEE